ncbi:hypothetical protein CN553_26085 [Bacillus cereus]|uniref:Uncharacterized protein n=1 Tax=Bacillus cereus TaxID=1396 RepID=A0A9X6U767_BACCE|nr:hypothetical protein [Bacillus cereus]PEN86082.1 hypothetical protein CN553_26085 [Bacillus cereus]
MLNKKLLSFSLCAGLTTSMLLSGGSLTAFAAENEDGWEKIENKDVVNAYSQYIQAFLHGPILKNVMFDKHKFTISKANITKEANGTFKVTGELVHELTARPSDKVKYEFIKKDGKITAVKMDVNRGGWIHYSAERWAKLANGLIQYSAPKVAEVAKSTGLAEVAKVAGYSVSEESIRGYSVSKESIGNAASTMGKFIEGDWEKELTNIINIFTLVDDSQLNAVAVN